MTTTELIFPDAPAFKSKALLLVETANAIEIQDDDGYAEVGQFLQSIKVDKKELDRLCDPEIDARFAMHKSAVALKKEYSAPLQTAEDIAKKKMAAYSEMRRLEREAEQKRLDDIARKEAEEKRKKEMAVLEQARKEREAKEAAEKKVRDAEIARLKKEGDAKAAKAAEENAKKAAALAAIRAEEDKQRAAVAAAKPLEIQSVKVQDEGPKAAGVSTTMVWTGELIGGPNIGDVNPAIKEKSLRLLVQAIAKGDAPLYLVEECVSEIRKMSDSTSGTVPVPGVRFFQKPKTSVRS